MLLLLLLLLLFVGPRTGVIHCMGGRLTSAQDPPRGRWGQAGPEAAGGGTALLHRRYGPPRSDALPIGTMLMRVILV